MSQASALRSHLAPVEHEGRPFSAWFKRIGARLVQSVGAEAAAYVLDVPERTALHFHTLDRMDLIEPRRLDVSGDEYSTHEKRTIVRAARATGKHAIADLLHLDVRRIEHWHGLLRAGALDAEPIDTTRTTP